MARFFNRPSGLCDSAGNTYYLTWYYCRIQPANCSIPRISPSRTLPFLRTMWVLVRRLLRNLLRRRSNKNVNGVENMLYMNSTSTSVGEYTLDVYFNLDKNADIGSVEVQNRVSQASSSMPSDGKCLRYHDSQEICRDHHVFCVALT